jgi:hypothetical protein
MELFVRSKILDQDEMPPPRMLAVALVVLLREAVLPVTIRSSRIAPGPEKT